MTINTTVGPCQYQTTALTFLLIKQHQLRDDAYLSTAMVTTLHCLLVLRFWAVWLSGIAWASINVVALRKTRLVSGWVTVCGRVNHLGM